MLRPVTVRTDRIDYGKATEGFHTLTEAQAAAYAKITDELESGKQTVLLHGVASSGKTEIYIQLIRKIIAEGKTALMLVPEISLTTQLAQRLRRVFGARLGVFHSRHSDHERVEVWNDMLRNRRFDVVLGTRASVFLPFHDLGLVIVDEEDDSGYKQSDPAPRYNGKHVALMLARQCGCPTLLGSATPSVETYSNCLTKRYGYAALTERYGSIDPPEMKIIDMREAYRKRMLRGHFTYPLINAIREALGQGEQVILFQNRRGYATFVECTQCAYVPRCPNCDVSLTYHKAFNKLTCHYCGHTIPMPSVCPECGCDRLDTRGFGTEQVEDEAAALFPEARTARMDLDTTRGKESFNRLLNSFENKEIDILIGTQMITKGLDFANVGLVGILNADNLMNYPDFRAHERAFQMLVQVGGRAGPARLGQRSQQVELQPGAVGHVDVQVGTQVTACVLVLCGVAVVHVGVLDEAFVSHQSEQRVVAELGPSPAYLHRVLVRHAGVPERLVEPVHIGIEVGKLPVAEVFDFLVGIARCQSLVGACLVHGACIGRRVDELRLA